MHPATPAGNLEGVYQRDFADGIEPLDLNAGRVRIVARVDGGAHGDVADQRTGDRTRIFNLDPLIVAVDQRFIGNLGAVGELVVDRGGAAREEDIIVVAAETYLAMAVTRRKLDRKI